MARRLVLFLAVLLTLILAAAPAGATQRIQRTCFREVPDCIEGRFAEYWKQNGGLPVFGFPLEPAHQEGIGGASYLVQRFERNRFELHPENRRPYDVLLGRLGDERLQQLGRDWQALPKIGGPPGDLCFFAPQTGHAACGDFFLYFRAHGLEFDQRRGFSEAESIALFGLPITDAQQEIGSDGRSYLTQWFERARFEYHPENADPYKVLLGRLGAETIPASGDPCANIPPSVNATITPNCFKPGAIVTIYATGFTSGERLSFTITAPDGSMLTLPGEGALLADAQGEVRIINSLPTGATLGLYTIVFRGVESGRSGVIYFKIIA